ncbi:MAG TPA: translation initiation factor IF-2 N-terminal domain-containing protein, partial [Solirubrobacterales bacterium]|nr:translation initiation factor IF-2 N-terminal domain-containing protein [Solirubrobacterales bacterium]
MAKKRVHEIARKFDLSSKEVLAILGEYGVAAKVAASNVDEDAASQAIADHRAGKPPKSAEPDPAPESDSADGGSSAGGAKAAAEGNGKSAPADGGSAGTGGPAASKKPVRAED